MTLSLGKISAGSKAFIILVALVLIISAAVGAFGYQDINKNGKDQKNEETKDPITPQYDVMVTKEADVTAACPGETITYTVVVTNTGNAALHNVTVVDSLVGLIGVENTLASGAPVNTLTFYYTYTVLPTDVSPLVNTVNVSAKENEGINTPFTIFNESSASVIIKEVCAGNISIVKEANVEVVSPGDKITYTICVTNTGNTVLYNITIDDSLLGEISFLPELGIGEEHCIVVNYTVSMNETGETIDNTACVTADDGHGNDFTDCDSVSVIVAVLDGPADKGY